MSDAIRLYHGTLCPNCDRAEFPAEFYSASRIGERHFSPRFGDARPDWSIRMGDVSFNPNEVLEVVAGDEGWLVCLLSKRTDLRHSLCSRCQREFLVSIFKGSVQVSTQLAGTGGSGSHIVETGDGIYGT